MRWDEVHDEAEQLEHAVSDRLIDRIDEMLGRPAMDPHGDPIRTRRARWPRRPATRCCRARSATPVRVVRVTDQSAAFLQLVDDRGLRPGTVGGDGRARRGGRRGAADARRRRPVALDARAASRLQVERA